MKAFAFPRHAKLTNERQRQTCSIYGYYVPLAESRDWNPKETLASKAIASNIIFSLLHYKDIYRYKKTAWNRNSAVHDMRSCDCLHLVKSGVNIHFTFALFRGWCPFFSFQPFQAASGAEVRRGHTVHFFS